MDASADLALARMDIRLRRASKMSEAFEGRPAERWPERLEDGRLAARARDGDRAAFGALYDRYARAVHGVLLASVPHAEVDDLVQDVFLVALRRLHMLRDGAAFGGWILTIARNRGRDHLRRFAPRTVARPAEPLPQEEMAQEQPGEATAANRQAAQLDAEAALATVRSLPEAYRETLILRLVEGMSGPEIASRTGLTPASVRVNLHRGMKLLRQKLGWKPTP